MSARRSSTPAKPFPTEAPRAPTPQARTATLLADHRSPANPQPTASADAFGGIPPPRPATRRPPHQALAGQGPLGLAPQSTRLARANLRRGRMGHVLRAQTSWALASPGIDRLNDDGVGRALDRLFHGRRTLAGPGRGDARRQGVQRHPGRTAQRLHHGYLLRRLHPGRRPSSSGCLGRPHPGRSPSATTRTIVPT